MKKWEQIREKSTISRVFQYKWSRLSVSGAFVFYLGLDMAAMYGRWVIQTYVIVDRKPLSVSGDLLFVL